MTTTAARQPVTIGFGNILLSEWTKLRSVRSTYWTALVAVLATIAVGALISHQQADNIMIGKDSLDGLTPPSPA